MRTYFTYFVSLRLRDRRNLLIEREMDRRVAGGIDAHLHRLVVEIPRRRVPVLPFALVHVQLDDVPVAAMEGRVLVEHRLHPVVARAECRRCSSSG